MTLKFPLTFIEETFESEGIMLVFPSNTFYSNQTFFELKRFYKDYIDIIPEEVEITWIIQNKEIKKEIQKLFYKRTFKYAIVPEVQGIWCGDWMPLFVEDQNKNLFGVQFSYKNSVKDEIAGQMIFKDYFSCGLIKLPLVLDWGCFEQNGEDFFILSKKIFKENPQMSEEEITNIFKKYFQVKDIYYFDFNSVLGHADILFKNVKKDLFIYSVFEDEKKNNQLKFLFEEISSKYPNCQFKPIPNEISGEIIFDDGTGDFLGEEDYFGNILGFITIGEYIIFPIFSERSKLAKEKLACLLPKDIKIIELESKYLKILSKLGGGLHCMTVTY